MPRGTREHDPGSPFLFAYGAVTLYGSPFQEDSAKERICNSPRSPWPPPVVSHNPAPTNAHGLIQPERFRLLPVRSPLLGESRLISFPPGTEMFHFPGLASLGLPRGMTPVYGCRVSPFGHPGITGCLRLPRAFRSLPRPSSPPGAEASTRRPYYLQKPFPPNLIFKYRVLHRPSYF